MTLALLAVAGTAVGLLISSLARTEEVATALVPIAVIPQIILAGLVAPLSGAIKLVAKVMITVYWGQQAIERLLPEDDLDLMGREKEYWIYALAFIVIHAVVAAVATILILHFTSGKRRR